MIRLTVKFRKFIALFFLLLFTTEMVWPTAAYALTSGPSQPESKGFQPVGVNDLVDLFTGDFRYNIPLMDVGGYPLNLSYASGESLNDESSWVGFGWSLTPGAVNRQLRGVPDDYDGTDATDPDVIEKQIGMKPAIVRGISVSANTKLKGKIITGIGGKLGLSFSSITGVNAEVGFNSTLSLSKDGATSNTMNLGVTSNNQDGGMLNGNVNFSLLGKNSQDKEYNLGGSLGFGYNATRGVEGMTLGASFSTSVMLKKDRLGLSVNESIGDYISFVGESRVPAIEVPLKRTAYSFSFRAGGFFVIPSFSTGITGSYSKQEVEKDFWRKDFRAFGLMNAYKGKDAENAIMDYHTENNRPYIRKSPYLPVPVVNNDLFSVTNQMGSGQYKVNTSSSGVFFNTRMQSEDKSLGAGVELNPGNIIMTAVDFNVLKTTSTSGKWSDRNAYKANGDWAKTTGTNMVLPETYFKKVGETSALNNGYKTALLSRDAVAVSLDKSWTARVFGKGATLNNIVNKYNQTSGGTLTKSYKDKLGEVFGYLTAAEAAKYGLEKNIPSYPSGSIVLKGCNDGAGVVTQHSRTEAATGKKKHHISEVTVLDRSGTRHVYGVPVYNIRQDEVSFSVPYNETARKKGLIQYANLQDSVPVNSSDSRFSSTDYRFSFNKQRMRGYATAYLLSGILSPDYVDVTGNGISDDDKGTAVKFNYHKLNSIYKWRTPFNDSSLNLPRMANYNEGFLTDKKDDKASYVYGEKEQFYLHSIESKTMLALFILEDRTDGLGVSSSNGDLNSSVKLKRLKEIRLYSKADLYKNQANFANAVPIKTVHFEYAYDLFSGVPNSQTGGKLTLKKIWFTFGNNNQGKLQPYKFDYNVPAYQKYKFRQYDRWGTYKPADSANNAGLTNAEYPYAVQDTAKANRWAGYWQMSKITLPSGGIIAIKYESDDYAYVQSKRSMDMCFIKGIGAVGDTTNIAEKNTFFIHLPKPVSTVEELKERYIGAMNTLYFKVFTDLNNKGNYEFIPGYAKIEKVERFDANTAKITVQKNATYNPVSKAAWDIMRSSLPKLAYPEYDNLDSDEPDFVKAIKSMVGAIGRISDIVISFDTRAKKKNYASRFQASKSWVRLCSPNLSKTGGGARVKSVTMSDQWSEMTGDANTKTASYGQVYEYTMPYTMNNGQKINISSGVASYEPLLGGDENPFKMPVQFSQNKLLGITEHYTIDLPLCEAYFPGPSVGYSRVTVKNFGADNSIGNTGTTVSEFFTARDFPTRVEATPMQQQHPIASKILKFFGLRITDHATVSQGYVVENSNMHGKIKSERIVDKAGQEISTVAYEYKLNDKRALQKDLNNVVPAITSDGLISETEIGVDYEFFTDMNEHQNLSVGVRGEPSLGFFMTLFPKFWVNIGMIRPNYDKKMFRSAVAIKSIQNFPILEKVIKTEKGSRIESENILWDAVTGDVLMTKTQNEFDDPVYSFTYPAHWAYPGMGNASDNQGIYLTGFATNANGTIASSSYNAVLTPGDELVEVSAASSTPQKYWIVKGTDNLLRAVNTDGVTASSVASSLYRVLRSGRRNLSSTGIGTIVSLNPLMEKGRLTISGLSRIIDAKAVEFKEEWAMPVSLKCTTGCPPGYISSPDGFCYLSRNTQSSCTNYTICASTNSAYSDLGTRVYTTESFAVNGTGSNTLNVNWTMRLSACGVWVCSGSPGTNTWVGYSRRVEIPTSKLYYVGVGGDNFVRLKINGQTRLQFDNPGPNGESYSANFRYWHVYPIYLTKGVYYFEASGRDAGSPAGWGMEVYDNTYADLSSSSANSLLNILFSTAWLRGGGSATNVTAPHTGTGCATCATGQTYNREDLYCYTGFTVKDPNVDVFNPYTSGILGNWRPVKEHVFDISRVNLKGNAGVHGATNIREAGYYYDFNPFWVAGTTNWNVNTAASLFQNWRWSSEVTGYNMKGMETENKDALNRFSAAQMGYLQSIPVAVASNAPLRNIAYDGFEDYDFNLQCGTDTCNQYKGHFSFAPLFNGSFYVTNTEAHSGNGSLRINGSLTMTRSIYDGVSALYTRDAGHQYRLNSNYPMLGFNPTSGGKYILSFWVKDVTPASATPGITVLVNGSNMNLSTKKVPVVEGWKRVEVEFTQSSSSTFTLNFNTGGNTMYVDDIRIHPYDAQLKSFAYDAVSLRLMAELDENNFSTFYEYDDEGILIRVKKETERGIMTIKESRTGVRKN